MPRRSTAETDSMILSVCARQHGVAARRQLLGAGLSEREVQYRIETGRLGRLHRGVYAVGPVTGRHQREMAAVLACGDGSCLGHRSAAACWELVPARPGPVDVITIRDVRRSEPGIRVRRVAGLAEDEVTVKGGLPITTPARTLVDLAGCVGAGELEHALARALRERLLRPEEIRRLLERYPRRPGRASLLALLTPESGAAFTRSEAERIFYELVLSAGLPRPHTNAVVRGFEVDFLWPRQRLIVEIDGRRYHGDDRAFETDRDRDSALVAAGYRVMRVTWKQITEQPRKVLVRIAGALARGED